MTSYKTYKGARLDLEFYKGKAVINYLISLFNDDNTDVDLSVYDSVHMTIAHKRHGTVVLTFTEAQGQITIASPATNDLYLDVSDSEIDIRVKEYYHECWGVREDDEEELLFHGIAEVI